MRKILSFFAFAAILLTFAACGGNEPEVKGFKLKPQALGYEGQLVINPAIGNATYLAWATSKNSIGDHDLRTIAEQYIGQKAYSTWSANQELLVGKKVVPLPSLNQNAEYVAFVCYVKPDEFDNTVIDGELITQPFKTMPHTVLNGEFTVDKNGKKVHFAQSNAQQANTSAGLTFPYCQWQYSWNKTNFPRGVFQWEELAKLDNTKFDELSDEEWWYLFVERPDAAKLFTLGKVDDANGLIILPDNWEKPEGSKLKTAEDLKIVWDKLLEMRGYYNVSSGFDGFEENKLNPNEWKDLEFAGAVFLPAAGSSEIQVGKSGSYWSSTAAEDETIARSFSFSQNGLVLEGLKANGAKKIAYLSIRPACEVK